MISEAEVQGHWIRDWIKAPGFEDHTTRVHWMQVGLHYADVRIPIERPDLAGASALSGLSATGLLALAQAEGFAGAVTLDEDQCTWHRVINWHGTPEAPDVGAISFDADGNMIEAGVHADYAELWRGAHGARSFMRFSGDGYLGFCARVGDACVLGIGRPEKPATTSLRDALAAGRVPGDIATLFDGLHAFGHWRGPALIADLATNPLCENQPVLTVSESTVTWNRCAFDGTRSAVTMRIAP